MPWTDLEAPNERGWRRVKCVNCGHVMKSPYPHEKIHCHCDLPDQPPAFGPGTELHNIIAALGITPDASCGCEAMRLKMNQWGVEGCQEHREEIIAHLKSAYAKTDWLTAIRAKALYVAQLIRYPLDASGINPLDPCEALLNEALRRAEKHNAK